MYMRIILLSAIFLTTCYNADAQSGAFAKYDQITGRQNAAIYNGPIYINPFRSDGLTHQYLQDTFLNAEVIYENQPYAVDALKYDMHQNKLVLQSIGDYNNIAIDLIADKISSFTVDSKQFVKLDSLSPTSLGRNQFFEKIPVNDQAVIYVRHFKSRKEIFKGDFVKDRFSTINDYFIYTNDRLVPITSKRDAISAFPDLKRKINDFSSANKSLLKSNRSDYMEKMLRYIGTLKN